MLVKLGRLFEVELSCGSVFLRVRRFERFWNRLGLPSH
jgi:hypothetical protein